MAAKRTAEGGSTWRILMKGFSLSSSKLWKTMFKKQLWFIGNRAGGLWRRPNGQLRVAAPDEFWWKVFHQVLQNLWKQCSRNNCGLLAIEQVGCAGQMGSCGWQHQTNFDKRFFTRSFKTFERIVNYERSGRWDVWAKWAAVGGSIRQILMKDFSPGSSNLLKTIFLKKLW